MKQLLCLIVVFASVLANALGYTHRHMPGAYHSLGMPEQPPFLGRVVGGVDANIADYPYQLSLRRFGGHFCGASVIAARWALSAAHCTFPLPAASSVQLRGGTADRTAGGVLFDVEEIINHPNYDDWTIEFDVCVLRTVADLSGANIVPIAMDPSGATHAPGSRAVVSGWGLDSTGNSPVILQRVDIPIVSEAECSGSGGWPSGWVTPDMICASEAGRDACNGDSGGPLVVGGRQIGIVSWGDPNCVGSPPGVYARVAFPTIRSFISDFAGV
ncbi:trypsin beta-like [Anopheles stephensi]|uniref:trypsin beta-like n=1 Tax=Anopheles stephensi TaxID=30069 RepID=UPI0009B4F576|nr:trypsin beta-like [Anopheles stephensi]